MANKFTDAVFHAKVPAVDKAVLWAIAHRTDNETGACHPSLKTVSKEGGACTTIVKQVIAYAGEIGILELKARRDGNINLANEYVFSLPALRWLERADSRFVPDGETDQGARANLGKLPPEGGKQPTGGLVHSPRVYKRPPQGWGGKRLKNSEVDLRSRSRHSNSDSTAETETHRQDTDQNPYINLGPDGCGGIRWQDKTNGSIWCSDLWWSEDPNLDQYPYGQPELADLMQASPTILHDKGCPCYPRRPRILCMCRLYEVLLDTTQYGPEMDECPNSCEQEDTDQNQEPNPRGVAPNPTGTSRPGTPGIDDSCMDAALPRLPAEQPCEGGRLHEWQEYSHTTDRCSGCGRFRTNPAVTQWTEADNFEVEYMEMVECYDPYDTYWSAPEEPTRTVAHRAALSPSEFARAIGAAAHWN